MNTEITDNKAERGSVFYDGACNICKGFVCGFGAALDRRGFACVPLQTDWVREQLNLSEDELMLEIRVLEVSGKVRGGAAGVLLLARTFWWALPLVWLAKIPGVFRFMDAAYRWGAARRYCGNGACKTAARMPCDENAADASGGAVLEFALAVNRPSYLGAGAPKFRDSLPRLLRGRWYLLLLPLFVLLFPGEVAPWVFMWAMAGALWLALKVFTLLDVQRRPLGRSLAYMLAWPGMDAPEFFGSAAVRAPGGRAWLFGALNIGVAVALIYCGVRVVYPHSALLAGWLGMAGIILVLHFGVFKCLGLVWRALGIPATPLMRAPICSRSLSEFWGRRWNTGFSIPARRYLMEPIARKFGTVAGLLAVFLVSGLAHELVISVSAGAGYGLPTLYFLIQAGALIVERKRGANRFLTILTVAAPALVLFHPPFVHCVIIPFLKAIGAL